MKSDESPCDSCKYYLGWVHILRPDEVWVDRPWCTKNNGICLPQKYGCKEEGGAKCPEAITR